MIFLSLLYLCSSVASASLQTQHAQAGNCWKELAPIKNGPRQEHGVAAAGNHIYVLAGTKSNAGGRGQDDSVEVYDIATNSWSDAPPLPQTGHHPNTASVNGKIYVLGALSGFVPTRKTLGNIYRYDPSVKEWEEVGQMPPGTERGGGAVAVHENTIYIAGGLQPQLGDFDYGKNVVDIVSSYDTVSGSWTSLPKLPEKRDHVGAAIVSGVLYVVGGRIGQVPSVRNTVFALNLTMKNTWDTLAQMPTARGGLSAAVLGAKIYTFGGEGNSALGAKGVFPNCESYDTVLNKWQQEPSMRVPRHGTQAVTVGNTIYIPGGGLATSSGSPAALF